LRNSITEETLKSDRSQSCIIGQFLSRYRTVPSCEVAVKIGRVLVEERLATCVNIISDMHSIYCWQDKIEAATEVVLIAKTRAALFEVIKEKTAL
jgi:uncharacterized protein involved in tolerance to divalent cations